MKKGFTLIELLVVVLIIGILAAIALPQYEKAVEMSRAAQVPPIVKELKQAVDMYVLANGYPTGNSLITFSSAADKLAILGVDFPFSVGDWNGDFMVNQDGHYGYRVSCSASECTISVIGRYNDEDAIDVEITRTPSNEEWTGDCEYDTGYYKYSKNICEYFKNVGLVNSIYS